MNSVTRYIRKAHFVDLEGLDELLKDFPEIDRIIRENNQDFAKVCEIVNNNTNFSKELRKNITVILLQFTNLSSEVAAYKYLLDDQTKMVNDLLAKIKLKEEKIRMLKDHANESQAGQKIIEEIDKKAENDFEIMIKTKNDKSISRYRESNLKYVLSQQKILKDTIYMTEDLKKLDGCKKKQLNDIQAVAVKSKK